MALAEYTIWIGDSRGYRQRTAIDAVSLTYVLNDREPGQFALTLPGYYRKLMTFPDAVIEVWRAPLGRAFVNEGVFFTHWQSRKFVQGQWIYTVGGPDLNCLHDTRLIAYNANTSYTSKTDSADDVMKAFVRENLGPSATDTDREIDGYGFSVDDDTAMGVSLTKAATRARLDDVLRDLRESSFEDATPIFPRMIPTGYNPLTVTKSIIARGSIAVCVRSERVRRISDLSRPVKISSLIVL